MTLKKAISNPIIILIIALILTLILRLSTVPLLTSGLYPQVLTPDSWFTLRQIETAANSFLAYTWFDPMTGYPDGAPVHWGPFLPWFSAIAALLLGTDQGADLIRVVSWVPVIFALTSIPLIYLYGKTIRGEICGLCASLLLAVVPGSYLIRSMYGYVDHHVTESFFMLSFSLVLIWSIQSLIKTENVSAKLRPAIIAGIMSGLILGLGVLNAPTMLITVAVTIPFIGIYGLICMIKRIDITHLVTISLTSSLVGAVITLLLYTHEPASEGRFIFESNIIAGLICVQGIIALLMWILWYATVQMQFSIKRVIALCAGLVLALSAAAIILVNDQISRLISTAVFFISPPSTSYVIGEYLPLSFDIAFFNYHLLLIMLIPGLLLMIHHLRREYQPSVLYLLVWTIMTGLLTIANTRYEILLTVPLILTAAYFITWIFQYGEDKQESAHEEKLSCSHNEPKACFGSGRIRTGGAIAISLFGGAFLISLLVSGLVVTADYDYQPYIASEDWVDGLLWLRNATPDTGIDYYGVYSSDTFMYPDSAYSIMSWWDYGHWILCLSHRIPVSNPFQHNIDKAASFFMAKKEGEAEEIIADTDSRFIITDADMLFDTMRMMIPIYSKDASPEQYMGLVRGIDPDTGGPVASIGFRQPYYVSMVTRLHVFDGSGVTGHKSVQKEEGTPVPGMDLEVIFPGGPDPEISDSIIRPLKDVPALHHYRLIWESNTSLSTSDDHDIRKVKIYERVIGAEIIGEGTIELTLITNRGREFTYRQKSVDGKFTLPYSTDSGIWPVAATGPYRIIETGEEIEVKEDALHPGTPIHQ